MPSGTAPLAPRFPPARAAMHFWCMADPAAILAERLSKVYRVKVRDPGLRGAVRALVRPHYREVRAVQEVSFTVARGEIVAFLGPNGAGKTTTLKMLTGLLYPTAGGAVVAGFAPWTGGPAFKRRIALVLGNRQQLVWDLPAAETLRLKPVIFDVPEADYPAPPPRPLARPGP